MIIWLIIPVAVYSVGMFALSLIVRRGSKGLRPATGALPRVTVVVAARNEEKTIEPLLDSLARQDYPPDLLEITIVNDNSTDRTPIAVSEFIASHRPVSGPGMRLIYNPFSGKKRAIRYGIEKSSGEIIITTDADCLVGPGWVSAHARAYDSSVENIPAAIGKPLEGDSQMGAFESLGESAHARAYGSLGGRVHAVASDTLEGNVHAVANGTFGESANQDAGALANKSPHDGTDGEGSADVVLGEVYQRPGKGFVQLFSAFEFSALQAITEAAVRAGYPVMCNAANMSFRRDVYLRHVGELRDDLPSGDDMFLLHAVRRAGGRVGYVNGDARGRVGYAGSEAAAVETAGAVTAAALLRQRARWASKTLHYRDGATLTLAAATAACNAAVTAAAVASLISTAYLPLMAVLYGLRMVPDYLIIARNIKKRSGKVPTVPFILSELIYPFYFMTVGVMSLFPSARRFGRR